MFWIQDRKRADQAAQRPIDRSGASHENSEPRSKRHKEAEEIDYSQYKLSMGEYLLAVLMAASVLGMIAYLFYDSWVFAGILSLASLLYPRFRRKQLLRKRKQQLNLQFKQALYSLSSSLGAGRSVENSFRETIHDLRLFYPDEDAYIIREFEIIQKRIENGENIEDALNDLSRRADLPDITNFADVFTMCKRTGGDLVEIIRRTSHIIGDKLEIQQEISVMIAQKKFESGVMSLAPLAIIAFMKFSSTDYMVFLYQGPGRIVMTVSLILLVLCYFVSQRIMNIKV